ncbi:hypothetical protein HK096_009885 [Nowakowskiella sp. JEL0078]|nr:hypothetical protein HK096_009885 [Nowakowskiella sp. JEL0078]
MFSYNWSVKSESIRTLAHCIWNSGIGVWIDSLKLISGDSIVDDIKRAVRETNMVQIFLTPEYLESRNCNIEFMEAIKFPGKLHVHVLQWDGSSSNKIRDALRYLLNDIKLSQFRITAHSSKKSQELDMDNETDVFIAHLSKKGKGWESLVPKYHAYVTGNGDIWDFGWWINNATSGGGVPGSTFIPRKIETWNLRIFNPFGLQKVSRNAVKIGNIFLNEDCQHSGNKASAFPWVVFFILAGVLLPLVDIANYNLSRQNLLSKATTCANQLINLNSSDLIFVNQSFCDNFYTSSLFTNKYDDATLLQYNIANFSAFSYNPVLEIFENFKNDNFNCSKFISPLNDPYYLFSRSSCLQELQVWFDVTNTQYSLIPQNPPSESVWVFTYVLIALFGLVGVIEIRELIEATTKVPNSIKPLLAVSNLSSINEASKFKNKDSTPNLADEVTIPITRLMYDGDEIPPVPKVFVAVHGTGAVAQSLRTFLSNLDLLVSVSDVLDPHTYNDNTNVTNVDLTRGISWVNVFVMSSVDDRERLYELRERVNTEVGVFIRDSAHDPVETIDTDNGEVEGKKWDDGSNSSDWLHSILFIDTRMKKEVWENGKVVMKESHRLKLASQIMIVSAAIPHNISLRAKDALFTYGFEFNQKVKIAATPRTSISGGELVINKNESGPSTKYG